MALIICPECNSARISDAASQCPNCGCSMNSILRKIEEKETKLNEEKQSLARYFSNSAESIWNQYCEGMSAAADEYNKKYVEIESKYKEYLSTLESQTSQLMLKAQNAETDICKISGEIENLGFFSNKKRKLLAKEISEIRNTIKEENDALQKKIQAAKDNCNNELEGPKSNLIAAQKEQKEIIKRNYGISMLLNHSADDVLLDLLTDKAFRGYMIHQFVTIKGPMTLSEIYKAFESFRPLIKDESQQRRAEWGLASLLEDEDFCYIHDIEVKLFDDDVYYAPLSSAKKREMRLQREKESKDNKQKIHDLELEYQKSLINLQYAPQQKHASVIKRGVAGAVIAGPAGAVLGGLSALDKNIKEK